MPAFEKATFWVIDDPWAGVTGGIWKFTDTSWTPAWRMTTENLTSHHSPKNNAIYRGQRTVRSWGRNGGDDHNCLNRSRKRGQLHRGGESGCCKDSWGKVAFDRKRWQSLLFLLFKWIRQILQTALLSLRIASVITSKITFHHHAPEVGTPDYMLNKYV